MDKQLRSEQEKFQAIFQNASLGILVINQNGNITLANDFLVRQFGYSNPDELSGKKSGDPDSKKISSSARSRP